jgi:mRNA interferase MazF
MEVKKEMRRGEIYMADFSPTVGSEQLGVRPALIIQNDIGNKYSSTVIVAILTGKSKKVPTQVKLEKDKYNLKKDSYIMLEHIRTIDKWRIAEKIATLDEEIMIEVEKKILFSLGVENVYVKLEGNSNEYISIPKQKLIELGLI